MTRRTCWNVAVMCALAGAPVVCGQGARSQPIGAQGPRPTQGFPAHSQPGPKTATVTGPGIIPIGSLLVWSPTNAPDTFTANTTFSSTPVLVDNGAVKIWQVQTPTGPNSEWDVFYMETVNGGPLATDQSALWQIVLNYTLSVPAVFDQVVQQWWVNGAPVGPLTDGIGSICCAAATNPILPGWSYYNSGFSGALTAGVQANWRQIYVTPYTLISAGGIDPNTANGFVFGLHFTLQPTIVAAVSASAFGEFPDFGPGSWIEIYGTNLATDTQTWGAGDFNGVVGPTVLGPITYGTSVTVGGVPAYVDFISPLQVNVQVPGGLATGPQPVVLSVGSVASAPYTATVNATEPGLLAPANFKIDGTQYVVAQFADGTYVLPSGAIAGLNSRPAKPGDVIVIYGIGFGSVSPDSPPGQLVQQLNTLSETFTMSFGGVTSASVTYDGLTPNYMGLYQFDVQVPNVAPGDAVPLTFTLGGNAGTQSLAIAIGN